MRTAKVVGLLAVAVITAPLWVPLGLFMFAVVAAYDFADSLLGW